MKMAPLLRALSGYPEVHTTLIHTGQHYDDSLSDVFFDELGMKRPDICLEVGSGTHGAQTARVLERLEQVFEAGPGDGKRFDRAVVVGDVNSTMAGALAAVKLNIPVAHVEAGLRSFDRTMPEEINRIVTDSISDLLMVSEPTGVENLTNEGHPSAHIHLVGNIMIDTLKSLLPRARKREILTELGLEPNAYGVVTLHRPANVDDQTTLERLFDVLIATSEQLKLVFPIHPRTQRRMDEFCLSTRLKKVPGILQLPPLGYLDFLALTSQSRLVVTDSGGLQEESTVLGIPCLTMRPNTERPITVEQGTSTLIANDPDKLDIYIRQVLDGDYKQGQVPELWDGNARERMARVLVDSCRSNVPDAR